jgi:hypothetical protein
MSSYDETFPPCYDRRNLGEMIRPAMPMHSNSAGCKIAVLGLIPSTAVVATVQSTPTLQAVPLAHLSIQTRARAVRPPSGGFQR